MKTNRYYFIVAFVLASLSTVASQPARRPMTLDDVARLRDVSEPQCSPDGASVAYVLSTVDVDEDKRYSHIWMVGFDGTDDRQITSSRSSEGSPSWSPDGQYLAFTSSRPGPAKGNQVWLLNRAGGEAMQLTNVQGRLQDYAWSPDSQRLALVIADPDPDEPSQSGRAAGPRPIVIDRYKFKQDGQGYLVSDRHTYIYLFDIATRKLERLTTGTWDESTPAWSPDGKYLAFFSNHAQDPDRYPLGRLFVSEAKASSTEKPITEAKIRGGRSRPEWSPDGKWIVYLESDEVRELAYGMSHLTVVASDGSSAPRRIEAVEALDRGVSSPRFTPDSASVTFLVIDDRSVYPAQASLSGGAVERLMDPPIVVSSPDSAGGCSVVLSGNTNQPTDVYAVEGSRLRRITHQNDALLAELELGTTVEVSFLSPDGTEVHGLLTKPVGYKENTRVPTLVRIHGGPNSQDDHTFHLERQFFAAHGYAVLAVNYRGSAGRGRRFSQAILADWGHYEVIDLRAGIDHVIALGVADPDRLGVGGWSYGGILTDYMIASDTRLKAATSGAGTAFTVSYYGTDHHIIQYDNEMGPPWNPKSWEIYQKVSYPFLHADRIKTPTLFLCGERDFNVPISGSEQMYQALKSLGVDTQLVIYPDEFHGIRRPSFVRDRLQRYLAWYDKYLK